jgi:hypothetical protein
MITINVIDGIKERDFTQEELNTQIATVMIGDIVVLFQQGNEAKYTSYMTQLQREQESYVANLKAFLTALELEPTE